MKTVLNELIERLDVLIQNFPNDAGLNTSKEIAVELLVREKEQIKESYNQGHKNNLDFLDSEDYFINTYKN